MTSQLLVDILTKGLTFSLAAMFSMLFFRRAKNGGFRVPLLSGVANRTKAFAIFIVSLYFAACASGMIEPYVRTFLFQNQANVMMGIMLPIIFLWLVFDKVSRK